MQQHENDRTRSWHSKEKSVGFAGCTSINPLGTQSHWQSDRYIQSYSVYTYKEQLGQKYPDSLIGHSGDQSQLATKSSHLQPLRPSGCDIPYTKTIMAKSKKAKSFRFTSTQGEWLCEFLETYQTLVKKDPDDSTGTLAPFLDDVFTKLEEKFSVSNASTRELVMDVSGFPFFIAVLL